MCTTRRLSTAENPPLSSSQSMPARLPVRKSHPCASVSPAQHARQPAAVADQWDVLSYEALILLAVC